MSSEKFICINETTHVRLKAIESVSYAPAYENYNVQIDTIGGHRYVVTFYIEIEATQFLDRLIVMLGESIEL